MHAAEIRLGPVLSFRGVGQDDGGPTWKVTAIVAVPAATADPVMELEGAAVAPPLTLVQRDAFKVLRYDLGTRLGRSERRVRYGFPEANLEWCFTVPSAELAVRFAYAACNGFSDPRRMREHGASASAVWQDLVANHDRSLAQDGPVDKEQLWHMDRGHGTQVQRFHVLLLGGDQLYFDSMWQEIPELKAWTELSHEEQRAYEPSEALLRRIDAYYFDLYPQRWLPPKRSAWNTAAPAQDCADALARIPTVMMWDDHDIFDGWGSYSEEMHRAPLPQAIFRCARQAFWVFQMQHALDALPALSARDPKVLDVPRFAAVDWTHARKDPLLLPILDGQPGFTSALSIGQVALLVTDLRTERSRRQVLGAGTWDALQRWLRDLPSPAGKDAVPEISHVLLLSSVPVSYPKLSTMDGLVGAFNTENVSESNADDLMDHWSHDDHEDERLRLVRTLIDTARDKRVRVSIVSGDVHVAAWGSLARRDVTPQSNWLRVQELTSSAVMHPAPSGPVQWVYLKLLNQAAAVPQPIGSEYVAEMHVFPRHDRYLMQARNWLAIEPDPVGESDALKGPRLWATWRCEAAHGNFSNHLLAVHPAPRD